MKSNELCRKKHPNGRNDKTDIASTFFGGNFEWKRMEVPVAPHAHSRMSDHAVHQRPRALHNQFTELSP